MKPGNRWNTQPPVPSKAAGFRFFPASFRAWSIWALKLCLSLLFCGLTLHAVPSRELWYSLGRIELRTAGASIIVFVIGTWLFESWRLLAASRLLQEPRVEIQKWARYHLESRALFYTLPAGLGAEGYLWWKLRRDAWSHGGCGYVVLFIRLLGSAVWALTLSWSLSEGALRQAGEALLPRALVHPVTWLCLAGMSVTLAHFSRPWFQKRLRFSDVNGRAWH